MQAADVCQVKLLTSQTDQHTALLVHLPHNHRLTSVLLAAMAACATYHRMLCCSPVLPGPGSMAPMLWTPAWSFTVWVSMTLENGAAV